MTEMMSEEKLGILGKTGDADTQELVAEVRRLREGITDLISKMHEEWAVRAPAPDLWAILRQMNALVK